MHFPKIWILLGLASSRTTFRVDGVCLYVELNHSRRVVDVTVLGLVGGAPGHR